MTATGGNVFAVPPPDDIDPDTWLHELTVDEAARRREVRRDLDQLTRESATLVDTMHSMAATGAPLTISARGVEFSGQLTSSGPDAVELAASNGTVVLVVTAGIDVVRPGPAPSDGAPAGTVRTRTSWIEQLRSMAAERSALRLLLRDGTWRTGRLDAVGDDVMTLTDPGDSSMELIATQSVVGLLVSG